jgi:uncharacterized protein YggE
MLLFASNAIAQQATQAPRDSGYEETVSVTGTGRATLTPDRFSFTAGVRTTAPTVEDAVNQNNARVAAVIAALKKAGTTDQEIRTSNFSIYPQTVYEERQPPRVTGYQVSNNVIVTKKEIAAAGRLLQVAISAGVNEASSLNFEVSDPSRGRDQGLRAAFDDARAKAALLAQAAGRTLGRALIITEGAAPMPPRPQPMARTMMAKAEAVSDVPIESGTNELSYTVSIVFALQ